jgi:hypothetical protein
MSDTCSSYKEKRMKIITIFLVMFYFNSTYAACRITLFQKATSAVNTYNGMGYSYNISVKDNFLKDIEKTLEQKGYVITDMTPREYTLDIISSTTYAADRKKHINNAFLKFRYNLGQTIYENEANEKAKYGILQLFNIKTSSGPGEMALAQYDHKFFQSFFTNNLSEIPKCQ